MTILTYVIAIFDYIAKLRQCSTASVQYHSKHGVISRKITPLTQFYPYMR